MVNVEIDGIAIQANDGAMIIEAADGAGIPIARFCYHKKLSIAANCRMCLVEVDKAAKPLPACATPVTEGMKIHTRSRKALDAQRGTMEFLLINHPLDCPICDQGGECDLQDLAVGYGGDHARFSEGKRVVPDKNLGPLVATDMTRCIHCTRCVRFGEEIAGIKELGATGRGEHMKIGTYVEKSLASEMSGNVIDLCPVGALTSKPFRYEARPWELTAVAGIAAHDCIGSNIHFHVRSSEVMRVLPRENEAINETWLSDRDRFSYVALNGDDRLRTPMIKRDGRWEQTDWETALESAVTALRRTMSTDGADQIGMLISPNATLEEMYLSQKLLRALGCSNIDHRLRQQDFSDQDVAPVFPWLGLPLEALQNQECVLLVGSNVGKDQPIAAHRLRKAALNGARIMVVNPQDYAYRFKVAEKRIVTPAAMEHELAAVVKALLDATGVAAPAGLEKVLAGIQPGQEHKAIAAQLRKGRQSIVLLGNQALMHPRAACLRTLAGICAQLSNSGLGYLSDGANSAGGWLAGALPHRGPAGAAVRGKGLHAAAMLSESRRAYVLLGVEPELDCADSAAALKAMRQAAHVVALTPFVSDLMKEYATVLLPVAAFSETSGTLVNAEGRWQSFTGAVSPPGEARPAWKVLRVLGNLMDVAGFDYVSSDEIHNELRAASAELQPNNFVQWSIPSALAVHTPGLIRLADVPIYAVDNVVRRAAPLQQTADAGQLGIKVHPAVAARLGINDGDRVIVAQGPGRAKLRLSIDESIPVGCVHCPAGIEATAGLGAYGAPIELHKG